jgi:hypothetical protein
MDEILLENGGGFRELNLKNGDGFIQIKRKIKNLYFTSRFIELFLNYLNEKNLLFSL